MGHTRPGTLPATRSWNEVVGEKGEDDFAFGAHAFRGALDQAQFFQLDDVAEQELGNGFVKFVLVVGGVKGPRDGAALGGDTIPLAGQTNLDVIQTKTKLA